MIGRPLTWGANYVGQLGDGTYQGDPEFWYIPHLDPKPVPGLYNFVALEFGFGHTVGLRADGTVWTWGNNNCGQLGQGSAGPCVLDGLYPSPTPIQVTSIANATAIAAGTSHTAVLTSSGYVYTFGANDKGQLGIGTSDANSHLIPVLTNTSYVNNISAIAACGANTFAVRKDGYVVAWGDNSSGQLGNGSSDANPHPSPYYVYSGGSGYLNNVIAIACGDVGHVLSLKADGTVWAWGYNYHGQLGDNTIVNKYSHFQIPGLSNIQAIAAGSQHSAALQSTASGTAMTTWGYNASGQLGDCGQTEKHVPTAPQSYGSGRRTIAAGRNLTYTGSASGQHNLGNISSSGENGWGQLGRIGNDKCLTANTQILDSQPVESLSVGGWSAGALKSAWMTSTTDGTFGAGYYSSSAIDTSGNLHVSYYNNSSKQLLYRKRSATDGSWSSTSIVASGITVFANSIVVDTSGYAHISYVDSSSTYLKYATNSGGSWSVASLTSVSAADNATSPSVSIAVDNSGKIHIGYIGSGYYVYYATNITGSWTGYSPNSAAFSAAVDIAVDPYGTVHLAYYDKGSNYDLKYANGTYASATPWNNSVLDSGGDVGSNPSIVLDSSNRIHISYYDATNSAIKYATNAPNTWWSTSFISRGTGQYSSIKTDANNKPHIVYGDTGALYYATRNSAGSWVTDSIVDETGNGRKYASLSYVSGKGLHVVYFDSASSVLKYASRGDLKPPTGSIQILNSNSATTYSNSTTVTLQLTCNDGAETGCKNMQISNDGVFDTEALEPFAATKSWVLNSANGNRTVYVRFSDNADNWSPPVSDSIFLDTVAPTGTLSIVSATGYTNNRLVTLNTSCSDAGGTAASGCAQMKFSTDGGGSYSLPEAYSSQTSLFLPAGDGTKFVFAVYIDNAGKESSAVPASIKLDTTPPSSGTVIINGAAMTTSTTAVTLTVTCSDTYGCASMQFSNDNSSWSTPVQYAGASAWTLSPGDGVKTVFARFMDVAGNTTAYTINDQITLDSILPAGMVRINNDATFTTSRTAALSMNCTDSGTGCSQMKFSNNGIDWGSAETFSTQKTGYLLVDGPATLWSWGNTSYGHLGNGTINIPAEGQQTPLQIGSDTQWVSLSTGDYHTLAIRADGTLWVWGRNNACQLGLGPTVPCDDATGYRTVPTQVGTDTDWMSVAAGQSHSVALKADGTLWSWGYNAFGQLGIGNNANQNTPRQEAYETRWRSVATGIYHTVGIMSDGSLWAWGYNAYGQLGIGYNDNQNVPQIVEEGSTWNSIASGGYHVLGIMSDGSLWSWGDNTLGKLGIGNSTNQNTPQPVLPGTTWSSVSGGLYHSIGIKADKSLWSWGYNGLGQLGIGTTADKDTPQPVAAGSSWQSLASGYYHSLGIKSDGSLWSWGYNNFGQLGVGGTSSQSTPQPVAAGRSWKSVTAANYYSAAIPIIDSKNVFVKFQDSVGNWSPTFYDSIILDSSPPVGSIVINNSAVNTTSTGVTLTLTCSDVISGCATMEFNNDGGTWTPPESFGTTKSWVIGSTNGLRTVNVRYTDTAGNSSTFNAAISLDNTPPITSATPSGGAKATALAAVLSCNDGKGINVGCTIYYTSDGSAPTISSPAYSGTPIAISGISSPVHLKFFSVDALGNTESVRTETYTFIAGYTALTLDLASPTLVQNGTLDVSGKLTRFPDSESVPNNGMDLSGLPVAVTITGPAGSPCEGGCTENTTTYSSLGHYHLQGINRFSHKGTYGITASFAGTGLHQSTTTGAQSLLVGTSAGYAIIVEGKVANDEGLDSHNKTVSRVYESLKERGFVDDNIMYFNYAGVVVPGVDAVPLKESAIPSVKTVRWAVETWAKERMNGSPAPLYLIMVDHGNNNTFYLAPDTISPSELNGWLGTLEGGLNTLAKREKRTIILGACYSGSFIYDLRKAPVPAVDGGRIVITSAAADEQSYRGPNEPDDIRSGEFFIEELFKQLKKGLSFMAAFTEATAQTRTFTAQGSGVTAPANGYGDTSVQHPLLDDNGDGTGSNTLVEGVGDGIEAALAYLGFGLTNAALGPADIKAVTPTRFLAYSASPVTTPLWLEPYSSGAVSSAWLEIKAPATTLTGNAGTSQLALDLPKTVLDVQLDGTWSPKAPTPSPTFTASGRYEVYYFTRSTNAGISEMKRSVVYKNKSGNTPPSSFNLIAPGAGGTTPKLRTEEINLVWEASGDTDGLTYTVQMATDSGFTSIVYQKEELNSPAHYIDSTAVSDQTTYYWRVLAIDGYGETRSSNQSFSFKTDNTNALPGRIRGYIYDNATPSGVGVANAIVTAKIGLTVVAQTPSGTSGAFTFVVPSGSYSLTATATGYIEGTGGSFTLTSGGTTDTSVTVTVSNPTLQIATYGSGSGTVSSNSGGIACITGSSSNCSAGYGNGTTVTMTATPDWKSLFGGWSGAYTGSTNPVGVTMSYHKAMAATFNPNLQARVDSTDYDTIQGAYNAATDGKIIKARVHTFKEHLLLDQNRTITINGGKDAAYNDAPIGITTVEGSITVRQGRMNATSLAIK